MNTKTEIWNGHEIRFVEKESGEWWAVAQDVTSALGIKNTSEAVNGNPKKKARGLPETDKGVCKLYTPGGAQDILTVSEKGIYRLIMRSHKPEAESFQDWIYDVIKVLRAESGLESHQIFDFIGDKRLHVDMMKRLQVGLGEATKKDYCTAHSIANKCVSTMHGFQKMLKKDAMTPEMLADRQPILADTVDLIVMNRKFGLGLSVSEAVYNKYVS